MLIILQKRQVIGVDEYNNKNNNEKDTIVKGEDGAVEEVKMSANSDYKLCFYSIANV